MILSYLLSFIATWLIVLLGRLIGARHYAEACKQEPRCDNELLLQIQFLYFLIGLAVSLKL